MFYCDFFCENFVEECYSSRSSSLLKWLPLELIQHSGDTACLPVIVTDKSSSSPLDFFNLDCVFFRYGSHMVALYSTMDLTNDLYAVSLSFVGQCFKFRRRNPNILFDLLQVLSICVFHLRSLLIWMPR